jgi:hypothetical protein
MPWSPKKVVSALESALIVSRQRIATILYLAFGCEFSVHVTSYCDDSQ